MGELTFRNTALLSFGNEEEIPETVVKAAKKDIARPDCG